MYLFKNFIKLEIPGHIDPYIHTSADISKAIFVTVETLLNDERNQIMGLTYVVDAKAIQPSYVSMWNITEFATLLKWGEVSPNLLVNMDLILIIDIFSIRTQFGTNSSASSTYQLPSSTFWTSLNRD